MRYQQIGLLEHDPARAWPGYTLIAPLRTDMAYLVNMNGEIVHRWTLPGKLAATAYLWPGGRLAVSCESEGGPPVPQALGGNFYELDWDGAVVWHHLDPGQHHDFRRLPNGNTIYPAWRLMDTAHQKRVLGGIAGTEHADGNIYEDVIREVSPDGELVWEWPMTSLEMEKYPLSDGALRYGYAHCNTLFPMDDGRILLCFRNMDMIAILNRETGAFDWEMRDLTFGRPHDARIVEDGRILLFANNCGNDMLVPEHSRVLEIDPATKETVWVYKDRHSWTFHSSVASGANRLPNGNTLICETVWGRVFEVTREGEIVWDFVNPIFETELPISEGKGNWVFRAYRYAADGPEIDGNLP
ncbi:MAG: arylsulfotransferase family protein [Bauldia litoralis]